MPRRNSKNKSVKHVPFQQGANESVKRRYPSENAAKKAAELRMLENMNVELSVYQGSDGGWYLTRRTDTSQS